MPNPARPTFAELKAEATRKLARVKAGAAVFGSVVVITFGGLSADLMNAAPRILLALLATALIVSGFLIARTFIAFYNCNENLGLLSEEQKSQASPDRELAKKEVQDGRLRYGAAFAADEYYIGALFYRLAIIMLILTMALFLSSVWWSAVGTPPVQIEHVVINPVRSAHPTVTPTVTVTVTLPPKTPSPSPSPEPGRG